jgi:hypothetical protein
MVYREKKDEVAISLWSLLNKGPLLDSDGELVKQRGLSTGEVIIHGVCAAIVAPQDHPLPPLDDIATRLSEPWRHRILDALTILLN